MGNRIRLDTTDRVTTLTLDAQADAVALELDAQVWSMEQPAFRERPAAAHGRR